MTGNYFELLGVKAGLGRLLIPADDDERAGSRVVLSHGLWQRQFGSDLGILSRTIRVEPVALWTCDRGAKSVLLPEPVNQH